jgi:hypothetical protein
MGSNIIPQGTSRMKRRKNTRAIVQSVRNQLLFLQRMNHKDKDKQPLMRQFFVEIGLIKSQQQHQKEQHLKIPHDGKSHSEWPQLKDVKNGKMKKDLHQDPRRFHSHQRGCMCNIASHDKELYIFVPISFYLLLASAKEQKVWERTNLVLDNMFLNQHFSLLFEESTSPTNLLDEKRVQQHTIPEISII